MNRPSDVAVRVNPLLADLFDRDQLAALPPAPYVGLSDREVCDLVHDILRDRPPLAPKEARELFEVVEAYTHPQRFRAGRR